MYVYLKRGSGFNYNDIKKNEIVVNFKTNRLQVIFRGLIIIDDKLQHSIEPSECTWFLDSVTIPSHIPNDQITMTKIMKRKNLENEIKTTQNALCITLFKKVPTSLNQYWTCVIPNDKVILVPSSVFDNNDNNNSIENKNK